MAVGAWAGALAGVPVPLPVALVAVAISWRTRRVVLVVLALGLLTSALVVRSVEGLAPLSTARFEGEAVLRGDPRWYGPSLRVDLQVDGRRVEAWARGPQAARLSSRLMGEKVRVAGRLGPAPPDAPWLTRRHIAGRLSIDRVDGWRPGDPASRAANGLRRTLTEGSKTMAPDTRSLYVGLLLGDQREQGVVAADDFRGSGLSHLLAVSGQNVAFVLVLVGPILQRLRLTPRLVVTLAVLTFFALVTRFEPSVLRATAMAGCAAVSVTMGREADSRRMLATAVIALLIVDPLIAGQLAFQLSVAATTGILLLSSRIANVIPGPRSLASAVGVTVAAQLAVAPLLIPTFGGMPVSALVANILAAPMAGPVVVWGLPAGLVAGVVGGDVARWLHWPTSLMVGWIAGVARHGAALPLGEIRTAHMLVIGAAVAMIAAGRMFSWLGTTSRWIGSFLVAVALIHPGWVVRAGPPELTTLGDGSRLHVMGTAVVLELDAGSRPDVVVEDLRRAGVGRVDVVVARHGGRDVAETVAVIGERTPPRLVLAPRNHRVPNGSVAIPDTDVTVGRLVVRIGRVTSTTLEATVSARDP